MVLADIQKNLGEKLANELGDSATFVSCDVTKEDDVAGAVQVWAGRRCIINSADA